MILMDTSRSVPVSPHIDKTILRNNALQFTSESFETSRTFPDNFGVIAGNFDSAGLSFGCLQYNFKSNSLQPILKDLIDQYPDVVKEAFQFSTDPSYYNELVDVLTRTTAEQIAWGDSISIPDADPNKNNRKILPIWEGFFNTLGVTPESIERQRVASLPYHVNAELWHKQFGFYSRRAYALLFDISTQKGGISQAVKDRVFNEFATINTADQTSQWIEYEKLERILNASADIDVSSTWAEDYRGRKYTVIDGGVYYGNVIDPENDDLDWYGYAFEWNTFQTDIYVVQSGDTVDSIATAYETDKYLLESINPLADTNNLSVGQAMFVPIQGTAPTMLPYDFRYMKVTFPSSITNPFEINILANTTQLQVGKTISTNVNPLYGAIGALIDGNLTNGVYWENQSPPYEVIVDLGEVRSDVTSIELYFAYSHASATVEVSSDGIEYIACTGKGTSGNTQLFGTPYIAIPKESEPEPEPVVGGVTDYVLPPPSVNIVGISLPTISDEIGMNKTNITFTFDIDVTEYTVNVIGTSHLTGRVAHTGNALNIMEMANMTVLELSQQTVKQVGVIVGGTEIVAEVDYTELYQEGMNRVNIYGKNTEGVWTTYNQESQIVEPPLEEPPPSNVLYSNIDFITKQVGDGDNTRIITYVNAISSEEISIFDNEQFEIWDYEGIRYKDDELVESFYNINFPNQVIFNFNLALITGIQTLTFQLSNKSLGSFYMKYWNFLTNSWDNTTTFSASATGFHEIKVENVEPYISNTGDVHILYYGDLIEDVSIDYANLVIERLE
jgi:hypothetical protein